VNDAILGNQYFAPHEVVIIDCPLLQRLKKIKQTGLVYQVFPSAQHTRFEHSLGVATVAERCFNAIRDRASFEEVDPDARNAFDADRLSGDLAHLRMAALLHDVGHGLCSHASEQIYNLYSDLAEFGEDPMFASNAPGEVLSYLIIHSDFFRSWFEENVNQACGATIDLDIVGQLILGKHPNPDKFYLAQIISSPYDADKLDYIARDSYYCGLALTVDLPRFYSMIATAKVSGRRMMVLRNYVPLEQILFSKMTLIGSVYHHQKVKCLDHMLRSLVKHILDNPTTCSVPIAGNPVHFSDPVQYLYVTDDEFFNQFQGFGDEFVQGMLLRFRQRNLFVRCVEVSVRTVDNWKSSGRNLLASLEEDTEGLLGVEKRIYEALPAEVKASCSPGEIVLSVPEPPQILPRQALIQPDPKTDPEPIRSFFPLLEWGELYANHKWRSYVYAPSEYASQVRDAAVAVLEEFGLEVNIAKSNRACHLV
jgi:HD superfamily phosphohydrolase